MNYITIIILVLLGVVFIISLYIAKLKIPKVYKIFQFNVKFDNYKNSDEVIQPFNEFGLATVKQFNDANFFLFTDYTYIDDYLPKIKFKSDDIIYGFAGMDQLANKSYLGEYMKNTGYIPKTWNISKNEFPTEDALYILKKNLQRQEGILITQDLNYITTQSINDGYVVAQELLQDVFLINKRKINMRVYVLIIIKNKKIYWYLYRDGFIYYTKKFFEKNSMDNDANITTGYIDRIVYDNNPLTHTDLYDFIGRTKALTLQANIKKAFTKMKEIYSPILLKENSMINGLKVNILGADIAPNSELDVTIMEYNKSPSLTYMDNRDKAVKFNMIKNMLCLINVLPTKEGDPSMFEVI